MFFNEEILFKSDGISNYRIPSLITTNDGTVLAFCNDRKNTLDDHAVNTNLVYAIKEKDGKWTKPTTLLEREGVLYLIGSAVHDKETNTSFIFVNQKFAKDEFQKLTEEETKELEKQNQIKAKEMGLELGNVQLVSTDNGKTWKSEKVIEEPLVFTHINGKTITAVSFPHGCSHGVQLKHGKYKGRLLCPSRIFAGAYSNLTEIRTCVYNNAFYSDDHGKTWKVSKPVQIGTGEGTLIELQNGDILYNSRAYFKDGKRYLATSKDGGDSYGDFTTDDFLLEETLMGCNASLLRVERDELGEELASKYLPKDSNSITLFVNPRAETRENMTICISFDECKTWQVAKTIYEGKCAYSSIDFSLVNKRFYMIYEKGIEETYSLGISAIEFDLEWLLSK